MQKLAVLFAFALVAFSASAQQDFVCHPYDAGAAPRQHPVDMQRMKVEVSFETEKGIVKGKVTHTFKPLQKYVESIFFDAPGITIKSALLDGKAVRYETTAEGVTVYPVPALMWDKESSLVFEYEATPKKGIYFIGWNQPIDTANKNPWRIRRQIWTQGQGIDNRHWIPMYDDANDKFITETVVTFDKKYRVLSNGNKMSEKDNGNGTKTWHYAMTKPHAGYLLMLGIGDYAIKTSKTKRGTPLNFYYYSDLEKWVEPTYRNTERMFDFLEAETGTPYPWESYSEIMVQDFVYGAMENTTATIFGDFFYTDDRAYLDRNYEGVNCHELTHQWFGDYITHRSFADIWLHESFATHYPKVMQKTLYGDDYYKWAEKNEMNSALDAAKNNSYPVRHTQGGSPRHYPKGSTVINMLKYILHDQDSVRVQEFNRVIAEYLKMHAYKNVETNDLYQAFQDVLGITPDWFFEEWVYRGGEPHYEVSYMDIEHVNITQDSFERATQITVKQIQKITDGTGLFKMPIEFEVHYADGTFDHVRQMIEKNVETVELRNPKNKQIAFVLFDPGNHVLKNVTFKKGLYELERQALYAPQMIDRYDALVAMRDIDIEKKRETLTKVYEKEIFFATKAEVVSQLVNDAQSQTLAISALGDKNVNVRKAAINGLKTISAALLPAVEVLLNDSSYNVIETALEKLCAQYPENAARYLDRVKGLTGMNNALLVKTLELSAAANPAGILLYNNELADLAGPVYEFRTRLNAIEALKRLNHYDTKVFMALLNASASNNSRLAGPAYSALESFVKQSSYKVATETYIKAANPNEKEKGVLKKLNF